MMRRAALYAYLLVFTYANTFSCASEWREAVLKVTFTNGTQAALKYQVPEGHLLPPPGSVPTAATDPDGVRDPWCCVPFNAAVAWYDSTRYSLFSSGDCSISSRVCNMPGPVRSAWVCGCTGGDCSGQHEVVSQTVILNTAPDGAVVTKANAVSSLQLYTKHGLPTRLTVFTSTPHNASSGSSKGSSPGSCTVQGVKVEYVKGSTLIGKAAAASSKAVLGSGLKKDPVTSVLYQLQGRCLTYLAFHTKAGRSAQAGSINPALQLLSITAPAEAEGLAALEGVVLQQGHAAKGEKGIAAGAGSSVLFMRALWGTGLCSAHASSLRRAAATAAAVKAAAGKVGVAATLPAATARVSTAGGSTAHKTRKGLAGPLAHVAAARPAALRPTASRPAVKRPAALVQQAKQRVAKRIPVLTAGAARGPHQWHSDNGTNSGPAAQAAAGLKAKAQAVKGRLVAVKSAIGQAASQISSSVSESLDGSWLETELDHEVGEPTATVLSSEGLEAQDETAESVYDDLFEGFTSTSTAAQAVKSSAAANKTAEAVPPGVSGAKVAWQQTASNMRVSAPKTPAALEVTPPSAADAAMPHSTEQPRSDAATATAASQRQPSPAAAGTGKNQDSRTVYNNQTGSSNSSSAAAAGPGTIPGKDHKTGVTVTGTPNGLHASTSNSTANTSKPANDTGSSSGTGAGTTQRLPPCRMSDPYCFTEEECYCRLPNGTFGAACPMYGTCLGACCAATSTCPIRMGYEDPLTGLQSVLLPTTCSDWGLDEAGPLAPPAGQGWGAELMCRQPKNRACVPELNGPACAGYTVCNGDGCQPGGSGSQPQRQQLPLGAMCVQASNDITRFSVCSCLPVF